MKRLRQILATLTATLTVALLSVPVYAKTNPSTSILPVGWDVKDILKFIVNFLFYGLGAVATIGVVVAGIMYLTARDNEQQVATAKRRLFEISLGLLAWAMLYTLLYWLIPGFNDSMIK